MEQTILNAINEQVQDNSGIRLSQHEFMKGKTYLTKLTTFCDKGTHLMDDGMKLVKNLEHKSYEEQLRKRITLKASTSRNYNCVYSSFEFGSSAGIPATARLNRETQFTMPELSRKGAKSLRTECLAGIHMACRSSKHEERTSDGRVREEPNELCVGPVLSDIPSQDAANTVVHYSFLKKSNRSKRNWGKTMAAAADGLGSIAIDTTQLNMSVTDPTAWATAMNNLGMVPVGLAGQQLVTGFDPSLSMMTGITPINPMIPGMGLVPPPPTDVPVVKEIIHCKSCTLFPPNPNLPPPSTRERPPGCKTVFVGGLPENATEEIIQEVFEQCGDITAIRKSKKNFCHIRFAEEFMVDKAIYLSGIVRDFEVHKSFAFCSAVFLTLPIPGVLLAVETKDRVWERKRDCVFLESKAQLGDLILGYRMRLGSSTDKKDSGRLHVDFAQARDDFYEWECKQRMLAREERHRRKMEEDRLRPPSPPAIMHYSEHEAALLAEKLKDDSKFSEAITVLLTWIERGEVNRRSANQFYSMVQSANSHVRRLMNEKAAHEQEMEQAKESFKNALTGILTQFHDDDRDVTGTGKEFWKGIDSVGEKDEHTQNEGTKIQKKDETGGSKQREKRTSHSRQGMNLPSLWAVCCCITYSFKFDPDQEWELRNAHSEQLMGIRREEEMEMSDDDSGDNPSKKLRVDDSALAAQAYALKEENDSLRWQLDAYRNEVELLKQEKGQLFRTEESLTKDQQLQFLQQTMQGMQQQLLSIQEELNNKKSELEQAKEEQTHTQAMLKVLQEQLKSAKELAEINGHDESQANKCVIPEEIARAIFVLKTI
ncbi:Ecto-NOX disulfide-thiol exchanger 1 [Willisornis vidua]|uniref:Ecto-NOX disulfide-thiol exchanger 1 n=1 Tax=Willisornis vidua TaxID=1566151 RepID=A0ABQ9DUR1_9PASS|nr:Ecto-NOX disulfide-thiol exchanger 1 [Willisornis vidua]